MKIRIEIDITPYAWRQAIADGWYERFGERHNPDDIMTLDNRDDAQNAIPFISPQNIEKVEVV